MEGNLGDEIIRLWIMSQSSVALHLTRDNIATEDDDGPVDKVVFLSRDLSTDPHHGKSEASLRLNWHSSLALIVRGSAVSKILYCHGLISLRNPSFGRD